MSREEGFFSAVERGDAAEVRALLGQDPALARVRDAQGATALHHAAFHGHRQIVDLLRAAGADLNARDALHDATPAGWAIHYLRERGGLLAIEVEDLLFAIERRDVAWARRLLARHPALREAVDRDGTPLAVHAARSPDPALAGLFGAAARGARGARPEPADPPENNVHGVSMSIKNALASLAVRDLGAAVRWYEELFGRPADSRPMPEVAEWMFERGGWLQVYQNAERAGSGSVTLAVSSLEEQVSELERRGLRAGEPTIGEKVKVVMIQDPDGNSIAFAEATDPSMAQ